MQATDTAQDEATRDLPVEQMPSMRHGDRSLAGGQFELGDGVWIGWRQATEDEEPHVTAAYERLRQRDAAIVKMPYNPNLDVAPRETIVPLPGETTLREALWYEQ
jgi:hypothetical protein